MRDDFFDVEKAEKIIQSFSTPHPEWKIQSRRDRTLTGFSLIVEFIYSGWDSTKPSEKGKVYHYNRLDFHHLHHMDEAALKHWLFTAWLNSWNHEAHEWLFFDGKIFKDPHKI